VEGAADALDSGGDARRLVAVAASYGRDAAVQVTGDAIQVHGGIGYTWEHDCHRLFKRAKFDQAFLGDPAAHRERLAALVLGQGQ
jgi:alkylation response protein AidB-like acyl-CoA dehydrogenase